jgi:hypothetical protein
MRERRDELATMDQRALTSQMVIPRHACFCGRYSTKFMTKTLKNYSN